MTGDCEPLEPSGGCGDGKLDGIPVDLTGHHAGDSLVLNSTNDKIVPSPATPGGVASVSATAPLQNTGTATDPVLALTGDVARARISTALAAGGGPVAGTVVTAASRVDAPSIGAGSGAQHALPTGTGDVVTTDAAQTLTGKSIDASQLTGTINSARLPAVGTAGTATYATVTTDANGRVTALSSGISPPSLPLSQANGGLGNGTGSAASLNNIPASQLVGAGAVPVGTLPNAVQNANDLTSPAQAQLDGKQPLDAALTALSNVPGVGLLTQTAADTFAVRSIAAGTGTTVTNPAGTAGNPAVNVTYGATANTATQGNDARLPPAPSLANRVVYDNGSGYSLTEASTVHRLLHGDMTWAQVDLATEVTGTLLVGSLPSAVQNANDLTSGAQAQIDAINTALGSMSSGALTLFFQEPVAPGIVTVPPTESLLTQPSPLAEDSDTATVRAATSPVLIDAYATDPGIPGVSVIPAGNWRFHYFITVDNNTGVSRIRVSIYSRTISGSETLLFSSDSPELVVGTQEYQWVYSQAADSVINNTDRVVVKNYAVTDSVSNRTINLFYQGPNRASHIDTPIQSPVAVSGPGNQILASPADGSTGAVTLRDMVNEDLPSAISKAHLTGTTDVTTPLVTSAADLVLNAAAGSAAKLSVNSVAILTASGSGLTAAVPLAMSSQKVTGMAQGTAAGEGLCHPWISGTSGSSVLGATFTLSAASGTYQDTGLSVTLPAAGTYLVMGNIRNTMTGQVGNLNTIKLYDATAAADIANSVRLGAYANTASGTIATTPITKIITVSGASTIKLYAARNGASFGSTSVDSDAGGYSELTYVRIA